MAPHRLRGRRGHITTTGTRAVDEPRLHLLGYGNWTGAASPTLIRVGQPARDPPSAAQVPHRLRTGPAFVRALRERDFTTVFALAHDVGISFNRIAEACALKTEQVSQIARGTTAVTALTAVERIAGGLRMPGALVGLAAQPWEDTAVHCTDSDHGEDPMKRRNLLRGAPAAGLTAPALAALTATEGPGAPWRLRPVDGL